MNTISKIDDLKYVILDYFMDHKVKRKGFKFS